MSVLHALMPPWRRVRAAPAWARWLARSERVPDRDGARDATVCGLFGLPSRDLPVAALRQHGGQGAVADGNWLCADPAYVRSEATGARLLACPLADLGDTDARELADVLRPWLAEWGELCVDAARQWNLRLARASDAHFTSPGAALGAQLLDVLPAGTDGRRWRRLFNEVQMSLHALPLNATRVAAGRVPVNALWFWGAGALPAPVHAELVAVAASDPLLRGLARLAGVARVASDARALEAAGPGSALLDLADLELAGDQVWLTTMPRWLADRRYRAIELQLASGERFRVRHSHRLRFWRRP